MASGAAPAQGRADDGLYSIYSVDSATSEPEIDNTP
jgi:hypothetical protein